MFVDKDSDRRAAQRDTVGNKKIGLKTAIVQMKREGETRKTAACSCGNTIIVPTGNCFVCAVCGETSGCG